MWAVRYSSEGKSRTLFCTTDVPTLRKLCPDAPQLEGLSADMRLIVSEPLGDVPGVWNEIPEATWAVVRHGEEGLLPFVPRAP